MARKRMLPVYLITGFLDSGKTSFIRQTMDEGQFEDGKKTLLLLCEEGEEEIDEIRLKRSDFVVRTIEDEDDVTEELLEKFDNEVLPGRVIIESNGLWDIDELLDAFPANWQLAEVVTTIDASTYEMYLGNMKMMMTNRYQYSNLVLFNRCSQDHDRAMFKRMVRAVNRRCQVLFEDLEGNVEDNVPEEMPFDLDAEVITVTDDDYGIFYIDTFENLKRYYNRRVHFKALAYYPEQSYGKGTFITGRKAMTCCAEDITFVGYLSRCEDKSMPKENTWYDFTGEIRPVRDPQTGEPMPSLVVEEYVVSSAPKDEVAYFY